MLQNDVYSTLLAWYAPTATMSAHVQISGICPATEKVRRPPWERASKKKPDTVVKQHIKKYSQQESRLVRETPELYQTVVEPYNKSVPPASMSWVYNILEGKSEAENVIHRDEDPETGFVLTPDL